MSIKSMDRPTSSSTSHGLETLRHGEGIGRYEAIEAMRSVAGPVIREQLEPLARQLELHDKQLSALVKLLADRLPPARCQDCAALEQELETIRREADEKERQVHELERQLQAALLKIQELTEVDPHFLKHTRPPLGQRTSAEKLVLALDTLRKARLSSGAIAEHLDFLVRFLNLESEALQTIENGNIYFVRGPAESTGQPGSDWYVALNPLSADEVPRGITRFFQGLPPGPVRCRDVRVEQPAIILARSGFSAETPAGRRNYSAQEQIEYGSVSRCAP